MLMRKSLVAGIAVAVALLGIVAKIKWLAVAALVLWVAAMLVFRKGNRRPVNDEQPSD